MPVSNLLNTPHNEYEWDIWAWSNKDAVTQIRQAIFTQTNGRTNLFEYQLHPISFDNFQQYLQNLQSSHDDFNEVLNLQGVDLEGVDIKDQNQLQSWVYLVWQETQSAFSALGI
jgi:hypothetical protein